MLNDCSPYFIDLLHVQASSIIQKGVQGSRYFVLYGNDQMFLDHFIDTYICLTYNTKNIQTKEHMLYMYSDYHFQFDITKDTYTEQLQAMNQLKKTSNITGRHHILHIRGIQKKRCKLLHHYIDTNNTDRVIVFITTPSLSAIDDALKSRCEIVNMAFSKEKQKHFCLQNIPNITEELFETAYHISHGNFTQTILRLKFDMCTNLEKYIIELFESILKCRTFLPVITKIREGIQKLYHINTPLDYICKIIIHEYRNTQYNEEIIKVCADCQHTSLLTSKDILVYEKMFIDIYKILKYNQKTKLKKGLKK